MHACRVSSHFFSACSVVGFRHPFSLFQSLHKSEGISSWEWSLTSTEDLPHCHTIRPLQRHGEGEEGTVMLSDYYEYNTLVC